jgi:hypothetical protein
MHPPVVRSHPVERICKQTVRRMKGACKALLMTLAHPRARLSSMNCLRIPRHEGGCHEADGCTDVGCHCSEALDLGRMRSRLCEPRSRSMLGARCVAEAVSAQGGARCPDAHGSRNVRFGCC